VRNKVALSSGLAALMSASLYAQEGPPPKGPGGFDFIVMFVLPIIIIMYFFFIRPQKKKEKDKQQMIENLKKGDRVTTVGGILGKVAVITDKHITLIIDEKKEVKMKVVKPAVINVNNNKSEEDSKDQE
jgi:preprotein translocase subunit YajC